MSKRKQGTEDESLAAQLGHWLTAVEASGVAILPEAGDELLQTIVEAAARLFGAAAASIALLDESQEKLVFRVATGAGASEVIGLAVSVGQGIAGYVVATGQPMAVSSVQEDPRFARDTARKTGYVPKSILAMPLLYDDRPLGVIEVLDKIDAPSFGMQDMELLGIFARQAAVAIRAATFQRNLRHALLAGLQNLAQSDNSIRFDGLEQVMTEGQDPQGTEQILAVARTLSSLYKLGDAERGACLKVLEAFAVLADSRPRPGR